MRAIALFIVALLLAALVVRNAFVDAYAEQDPARAAAIWPGHPSVVLEAGLGEVGIAAAAGRPVDPATIRRMLATSAKAPLAVEPLLVRGVAAQVAGDEALSVRAFLEARRRDPRSVAARYFLADHYLKAGQVRQGLREISALTRLVPLNQDGIAPHLAAFARAPGGEAEVRRLLREQPHLEPLLLNQLAANPDDVRLLLSLWDGRSTGAERGWQQRLVTTLVSAGRYPEARAVWRRFDPRSSRSGELVDARFEGSGLPPFGWTLASGAGGVAEPQGGGRLHILYYGRDGLVLASQILLLEPGNYRLAMRLSGASPAAKSLAWTVKCLPASKEVARMPLAAVRGGVLAGNFAVPAQGCEAQQLELTAPAPDIPEQVDVTIGELGLSRIGG